MKSFNVSLLFVILFSYYSTAIPLNAEGKQDTLSQFTGKYQTNQGMQVIYADVYIDQGKLTAKASTGETLVLDQVSGDNFIIANQHVPLKFIRDKDNKIAKIVVNGSQTWIRTDQQLPGSTTGAGSFNVDQYLGDYQLTAGGQVLKIAVSAKNGKLWATQLWDGGTSALDFASADNFIVNALSVPIKFNRDKDNQVIQLQFNNHDLFTKVKK